MKGDGIKLAKYMDGAGKRFVIPVYQRNYDWKIENCKQLYDDLISIIRDKQKSHFFGSIVSRYNEDGKDEEYLIIDGQQRLTTVSLLLLSLYNLIQCGLVNPDDKALSQKIWEGYLVDEWQPEDKKIKLKPVKNDQMAFSKLFENEITEFIANSNLTRNYNYFIERIQKNELSADQLYDAFQRLEIINITLSAEDNPQLVFERLNSTGLALSEGDKIRNYILMGLDAKQQNEYYEKYWNQIEICVNYDVSSFVRDYLSIKNLRTPNINKVYREFKKYAETLKIETKNLLLDLLAYAKRYKKLINCDSESRSLNACLFRLNWLDITVTRPFFMEVLRLYDESLLQVSEVTEIFQIIESFLFRRQICDLPTNALNKIFVALFQDIIRFDNTSENFIEKLKYALLLKRNNSRFPLDNEFIESFSMGQIYLNRNYKNYIMERFENYDTAEDKDIYRHLENGTYSIEHIMPQILSPVWMRDLGENYSEIHKQWLHRVANLTLTAYNSKYSNRSFLEKKNMEHGFAASGIRMNAFITIKEKWGLEELEERNKYLMDLAKKIWMLPHTTYSPLKKPFDSITLDDDYDVSSRKLIKYNFKGYEQLSSSWTDMFEQVLKMLHETDQTILFNLAMATNSSYSCASCFSTTPDTLRESIKIDTNVYIEKNSCTKAKLNILRNLFKIFDENPADLVFYLKEKS